MISIQCFQILFHSFQFLLNFQNFNPCFGRVNIKHVKKIINNQIKIVINKEHNDNHILFENNINKNFLCDHLSYIQKHYIININSFYEVEEDHEEDHEEEDHEEEDYEEEDHEEEDYEEVAVEELQLICDVTNFLTIQCQNYQLLTMSFSSYFFQKHYYLLF